jgi:hypothetical protein
MPLFRRAIEFRKYHAVPFNWPFFTAYVEVRERALEKRFRLYWRHSVIRVVLLELIASLQVTAHEVRLPFVKI